MDPQDGYKVVRRNGRYGKMTETGWVPLTDQEMGDLKIPPGPNVAALPLKDVEKAMKESVSLGGRDLGRPQDIQPGQRILNEQATPESTRLAVKWLYRNPDMARKILESQGWDVRAWGDGFNFALKRKDAPNDPWRLLDPEYGKDVNFVKLSQERMAAGELFSKAPEDQRKAARAEENRQVAEFGKDMLDLGMDAAQTLATIYSGGAGGVASQILRTTLASGAVELTRESAGAVASGNKENIDPATVAAQGVLGGAASALPPAFHFVFDKVSNGLLKFGAKIIGIGGKAGTELMPAEVVNARRGFPGYGRLATYSEQLDKLRAIVGKVGDANLHPFPESVEADTIAAAAEANGVKVSGQAAMDYINGLIPSAPAKSEATGLIRALPKSKEAERLLFRDKGLAGNMKELLDDVATKMEVNDALDPSNWTPSFAIALKRDAQARAAQEGSYAIKEGVRPIGKETKDAYEKFAAMINDEVRSKLDATQLTGPQGMNYSRAMDIVAKKTESVNTWKAHLNTGKNQAEADNHALSVIGSVFNKGKGGTLEAAVNFDKLHGTDITSLMKEPVIGEMWGDLGEASMVPRFSATGVPLGTATIGGLLGFNRGYKQGGVVNTVLNTAGGAAAGGLLASPMGVLAITRGLHGLDTGAANVSPIAKPILVNMMQEFMRRKSGPSQAPPLPSDVITP